MMEILSNRDEVKGKTILKIVVYDDLEDIEESDALEFVSSQFTRDEELIKCLEKNYKIDGLYITCEEVKVNENE